MHTEHLTHVHPVRVLTGWLAAVAVTGIALFAFVALGLMGPGTTGELALGDAGVDSDAVGATLAVAVGFFAGGWLTGIRTLEAPILHGIGLGLTSLVAWVALNFVALLFGMDEWSRLSGSGTAAVLLVQIAAAVAGCWVGSWQARGRSPEEPLED